MIDEIEVVNFKAFRELSLRLSSLTLLTGANAVGKSTVMQALALLRQSFDAGMLTAEDGGLLLNGDIVELGTGRDVLHEDYTQRSGRVPEVCIGMRESGRRMRWCARYAMDADVLDLESAPDDLSSGSLFASGFQYLKADRIVPAVHYPRSYEAAVRRSSLGTRGEHTVNYLRVYGDDHVSHGKLRHRNVRSARLLDQAEAWFQEICPGVNLHMDDLAGTDLVRLSYGFFGRAGLRSTMRYRPTNVGFGLTYVLPVVVACLSAKPGRIVFVENPEAHLHPRGQTAIAHLACCAAAAGAQIIVESHSDHVLNAVRLAVKERTISAAETVVHYFDRSDGVIGVSSPSVGADGMLSHWPEGFFDEWDRSLDRLLD